MRLPGIRLAARPDLEATAGMSDRNAFQVPRESE